jgi:ABC-2 type transport system ATP-binding protein
MLQIENYRKYYGRFMALEIPELTLPPGIHWIKGRNGSGKTTFFKSIAGLSPFQGEIILAPGIRATRNRVAYRMVVNYGEAEPLYPDFLTAWDLISFVAQAKKASPAQVDQLTEKLGMQDYLKQPAGTYSSGMLKKLSLALAFLGTPKVIVLDEPFTTIDDRTVATVYELINEYHQQRNVMFLLSSHHEFNASAITLSSVFQVENQTIRQLL